MSRWVRVHFKGQQVWAEADDAGQPRDQGGGKVTVVYRLGGKGYTTYRNKLAVMEGYPVEEGPAAAENPSSGRKSGGGKKKKGRSDSEIHNGGPADLTDPDAYHLWSDGACSGNPGPAGAGTVLIDGASRTEWSTWLGRGTNNIAELVGILQGIQALPRPVTRKVVVHTDSTYGIGVLAKNWKAKANAELIAEIRQELKDLPRVVWHWVRGHEGVALNERCDELARQAIARRDSTTERFD
jgi:ribonuclease HI